MQDIDNKQIQKTRNPEVSENDHAGLVSYRRTPSQLFQGWGPKLMAAALAIGGLVASTLPATAAVKVIALATCAGREASLISHPDAEIPSDVNVRGETVLRIDLSAMGQISSLNVQQSAGDPELDWEAMRVARGSRFTAASAGCQPAADEFLYKVIFSD